MRQRIIDKGVEAGKVRLIPNFVDVQAFTNLPRSNEFSRQQGLEGKFVVSYAGNMGKPQALDMFIRAWAELRDCENLHLLMVGSGSEVQLLKELARELQLRNVTFLPLQPYSLVPLIYATPDLSVVSQSVGTHSDGIPSKVYRIMGSSRAVLAVTSENSDLGELVRTARGGAVVAPNDVPGLVGKIRELAADPEECHRAGERARTFVAARYGRTIVSGQYADLVAEIAARLR